MAAGRPCVVWVGLFLIDFVHNTQDTTAAGGMAGNDASRKRKYNVLVLMIFALMGVLGGILPASIW